MKISEKEFKALVKENLTVLENYKFDKNGKKQIEIFGIEKLYEAIKKLK